MKNIIILQAVNLLQNPLKPSYGFYQFLDQFYYWIIAFAPFLIGPALIYTGYLLILTGHLQKNKPTEAYFIRKKAKRIFKYTLAGTAVILFGYFWRLGNIWLTAHGYTSITMALNVVLLIILLAYALYKKYWSAKTRRILY